MELRHLRYFVAVAEEEHLGRAARRLHVSPSPLSQQIQQLEEELGVALFARIGRGLQLTDAGRAFLARARAMLADLSRSVAEIRSASRGEAGRISLGFTETTTYAAMLPAITAQLSERHPRVALELSAMTSFEERGALLDGRIDAAFGNDTPDDRRLRSQRLVAERVMVALPRRHRLAARRAVTLRDIEHEPIVWMARSDVPEAFQKLADQVRARGFGAQIALEARSVHMRLAMVASGLGVTVEIESTEPVLPDAVVLRPLSDITMTVDSVLSWRAADQGSVVLRSLREIAEAVARAHPVARR
jgi:DNA-binding transcriptional LysR family regulator